MAYDPMEVWEHYFDSYSVTRGRDVCGAEMDKSAHGNRNSAFGWEVDHIMPESRGGSDALDNLRPLHWENNDAKGNNLDGNWYCRRES